MPRKVNLDKKPSRTPFQSQKMKKTVERVLERLNRMKEMRKEHGDDFWDTADRLFLNIPDREPEEEWMANVFVPFILSTILAILSEITSRRTRWKLLPVTKEDEDKSDTLEAITEFTLDKGHWDDESFKRDMDKLVYGTSIWKEYYREDRRVIRERVIHKDGSEEIKEKDIHEFNDVYGQHIPIRNFYLDDAATEIRNARDCIERKIMDIRDFKVQYSKYRNSKKVKEWGFIKPTLSEREIRNIPEGGDLTREGNYIPSSILKDNEVEIIEYWNKPKDEHILIANGILVTDEPNPYDHKQLPYAVDICIPKLNRWTGIGVCELLFPLNEELNTWRNMGLDQAKVSLHRPVIMDGMTIMDEDEYKLRPGAIIPSEGGNAKTIDIPMPDANYHAMTEEIRQDARVASGLDVRFAEATNVKGNDTATEILRLQEASLRRIGLLTKVLEIKALPRIGMLRTMNIQQFYKDPLKVQQITNDADQIMTDEETGEQKLQKSYRVIRVKGEGRPGYEFKEVKPEDIRGNFDVYVVPQSTQPMSQAVLVKRLNVAINTVLQSEVALQIVKLEELFKHFFKNLDLPDSIVKDVLPSETEKDAQLAQEENQDMASGSDVKPTTNPSMQHTMTHYAYVHELDENLNQTGKFTPHFEQLPQSAKDTFFRHIKGEEQQHKVKGNIRADRARTPNRSQGMGTQTIAGGGEVEAVGEGAF